MNFVHRIGIIGCGWFSTFHIKAIYQLKHRVQLIWVADPNKEFTKVMSVSPQPGSILVWPSNFLYPHSVEKVTKGKRYTVVSWLL